MQPGIHYAKIENSERLQRALGLLRRKGRDGVTTLEFMKLANIAAVSAVVTELRRNGVAIDCHREKQYTEDGGQSAIYRYTLTEYVGTREQPMADEYGQYQLL